MGRILLVEDDLDIRSLIARALSEQGHDIETSANGIEGLDTALRTRPDLVLLDLGLPDVDGSDVLRMIRSVSDVPIIVVSARGAEQSVIQTLDAGADDYLIKPFSVGQLQARVRAVMRRRSTTESDLIRIGPLSIEPAGRVVRIDDRELSLDRKSVV